MAPLGRGCAEGRPAWSGDNAAASAVRILRHHRKQQPQRGAAALVVTMVLFFAMVLVAGFANRGLLLEQRASASQYRAAQAFEAAEAGLEWALAQLADADPLGGDCQPSADPAAQPLRDRLLRYDAASGGHLPQTWSNGGVATALQPACMRSAGGWTCSCPVGSWPTLTPPSPAASTPLPAFVLRLAASPRPGVLQLLSTGCTGLGGACRPGVAASSGNVAPDATARVQVAIALVPAIATLPIAPLTLKASLAVGAAPIGLHNTEPSTGGVVLHAGGGSDATAARITTLAGQPPASALLLGDATLQARSADGFFTGFFGLDKAAWRGQAAVRRVNCGGSLDCGNTLRTAIGSSGSGSAGSHRLIWVDGDLPLSGALALGSDDRPVLIVASGTVRLRGAVAVHGIVYGAALAWTDTPAAGASVRGALISEAGYSGNGAPDLVYDAAVLARLRTDSGSFTRVPGSWRDF